MYYVATLVASDRLSEDLVTAAVSELASVGAASDGAAPTWLAPGRACDLPVEITDAEAARTILRNLLETAAVDFAVQPRQGRRKQLLVTDMESTVIRNEMLDELAEIAGIAPQVEQITTRAMRGEIDFETAVRKRVGLLSGLPVTALEEAAERIETIAGAHELISTMRRHGALTVLVSGGFGFFADIVRDRLEFDRRHSNQLMIADGRLCGELSTPLLDGGAKRKILLALCDEIGIGPDRAAAVGDGANDLPMLDAAGLGVAFHGKPIVADAARFRVDHGDLTTLLFFQGYREDEVVLS